VAEQWIDEGPITRHRSGDEVRKVAQKAVKRGSSGTGAALDPSTRIDVEKSVPAKRQAVLSDRLQSAQNSLERERFSEAKRIGRSLVKEMGGVAAVHEVIGLASYRLGQWRDATAALEVARSIRPRVEDLPVLADCYRAQRRWKDVDEVWAELKQHSPSQEILSEGRIVYAGSLADRGDIFGAIAIMMRAASAPRRVRDHHLRQWYVLADLYDRAGNVQKAREFFKRVASIDSEFSDVKSRLSQL
jgi:tetratricopeptide (TPR) repeat protein